MSAHLKGPRDHGLSLLELVVAMALFALVAVMGLQLLTGTLRMRDRLETTATETAELSRALALLRADLSAAVPLLFQPPDAGAPRSALVSTPDGFHLSTTGQPDLPPIEALGFHRIEWRVTPDGTLARRLWPVLSPASATAQSPEIPVLTDVTDLSLRSFWTGQGWVSGTADPAPIVAATPAQDTDRGPIATNSYTDQLPVAVEVTLQTRAHGTLVVLEVLQ
ncbi:type II secretion system protein GspJ [Shimia sp. Alg240-R146]|uniref:type II secretion system protein GspJ n=1 Tax=Shimia sp. Alg240-R146 TaxID=2993449 RepID=UPI0022E1DDCC|nr:type II secretion system protein GspJ [Shimia sp. Alg240-R146]